MCQHSSIYDIKVGSTVDIKIKVSPGSISCSALRQAPIEVPIFCVVKSRSQIYHPRVCTVCTYIQPLHVKLCISW